MLFFRTEDSSRKEKKEISFLSGKFPPSPEPEDCPGASVPAIGILLGRNP